MHCGARERLVRDPSTAGDWGGWWLQKVIRRRGWLEESFMLFDISALFPNRYTPLDKSAMV